MSYSRWSHSFWYCFPMEGRDKDTIFEICTIGNFTYKELKTKYGRKKCIRKVKAYCKKEFNEFCQPNKLEMEELELYMKSFVKDYKDKKWGH